jgi:hypothetical protein
VNYGERRGVDMALQAAEWHAALGAYPLDRLNRALSEHIRTSTWWPTIANLVDLLREETPAIGLPRFKEAAEPFCRDGRTQDEEIAFRTAQALRWKRERPEAGPVDPIEAKTEPKAASTSAAVSYAVYHSCVARRARGEVTCEPNCIRAKPGARRCFVDERARVVDGMDDENVATGAA